MERKCSYDFAKGLAVVWVIFFHTYQLYDAAILPIVTIMGTLHNPLFFLVSGILLSKSIGKTSSLGEVLKKKFVGLMGVFILWTIIETLIYFIVYKPVLSLGGLIGASFWAVNHLWFFPVLFISSMIVALIHCLKLTRKQQLLIGIGWIILGVIVGLFSTFVCKIVLFSFLVWFGGNVEDNRYGKLYLSIYLCAVAGFILTTFITYTDNTYPGVKCDIYMLIMLLGGIVEYYLVSILPISILSKKAMCFLGRNSLYYYVLSPLVLLFNRAQISLSIFLIETVLAFAIPTVFVLLFQDSIVDCVLFKPFKCIHTSN